MAAIHYIIMLSIILHCLNDDNVPTTQITIQRSNPYVMSNPQRISQSAVPSLPFPPLTTHPTQSPWLPPYLGTLPGYHFSRKRKQPL